MANRSFRAANWSKNKTSLRNCNLCYRGESGPLLMSCTGSLYPPHNYSSATATRRELYWGIITAMMTKRLPSKHSTLEGFCRRNNSKSNDAAARPPPPPLDHSQCFYRSTSTSNDTEIYVLIRRMFPGSRGFPASACSVLFSRNDREDSEVLIHKYSSKPDLKSSYKMFILLKPKRVWGLFEGQTQN